MASGLGTPPLPPRVRGALADPDYIGRAFKSPYALARPSHTKLSRLRRRSGAACRRVGLGGTCNSPKQMQQIIHPSAQHHLPSGIGHHLADLLPVEKEKGPGFDLPRLWLIRPPLYHSNLQPQRIVKAHPVLPSALCVTPPPKMAIPPYPACNARPPPPAPPPSPVPVR